MRSQERYGYGIDAQWNDDFHHALHGVLTGERTGYYADFGSLAQLSRALQSGYVYAGEFSTYRQRRHGAPALDIPAAGLVVYSQNHDQVGNRMLGDRLSHKMVFERLKVAAGAVLLSPYVPLLFMGEEYGETAPFQYFVSHGDPDLVEAVRNGRQSEFASFAWHAEPPDPQSEETFRRSKLNHQLRSQTPHSALLAFYTELIRLRKRLPSLSHLNKANLKVDCIAASNVIRVHRWSGNDESLVFLNFGNEDQTVNQLVPEGLWLQVFDSSDARWKGRGSTLPLTFEGGKIVFLISSANSVAVFQKG